MARVRGNGLGSCGCKWPVDQEEQGQFPVTMETSDLFSTNNWLLCIPWESHQLLFGVGGAEKIILFVLACILIKRGGAVNPRHTQLRYHLGSGNGQGGSQLIRCMFSSPSKPFQQGPAPMSHKDQLRSPWPQRFLTSSALTITGPVVGDSMGRPPIPSQKTESCDQAGSSEL